MPIRSPVLRRFLSRLHRRAVALRVVERTGVGLLGGAVLAVLLTALLWWQGRPTLSATIGAAISGAALGFVWGVVRRPTVLEAAVAADRQLDLDDLLGTVVASGESSDPWAGVVLASAEARCRTLSPSAVVLSRLGVRAWGGIGLASAMAMTLALLAGAPADSRAGDAARPPTAGVSSRPADRPLIVLAPDSPAFTGPHRDPQENANRPGGQNADPTVAPPPKADGPPPTSNPSDGHSAATPGDSGSSGTGRTDRPPTMRPDVAAAGDPTTAPSSTRPRGATTRPAGGVAAADATPVGDGAPAGRTSGSAVIGSRVPPWQSDRWAQDADTARKQIDAGRVPAAYRDLVREYFEAR